MTLRFISVVIFWDPLPTTRCKDCVGEREVCRFYSPTYLLQVPWFYDISLNHAGNGVSNQGCVWPLIVTLTKCLPIGAFCLFVVIAMTTTSIHKGLLLKVGIFLRQERYCSHKYGMLTSDSFLNALQRPAKLLAIKEIVAIKRNSNLKLLKICHLLRFVCLFLWLRQPLPLTSVRRSKSAFFSDRSVIFFAQMVEMFTADLFLDLSATCDDVCNKRNWLHEI